MNDRQSPLDAIIDDPANEELFAGQKAVLRGSTENGRIISSFEEINTFIDAHGFVPGDVSDDHEPDFMEDALAARVEAILTNGQHKLLLEPYDRHHLLGVPTPVQIPTTMDDILAFEHPIFAPSSADEIFNITHLPQNGDDERVGYDAASRVRCPNFEDYEPVFARIKDGLKDGSLVAKREVEPNRRRSGKQTVLGATDIQPGTAFILNGIIAYVVTRDDGVTRTINRVRDAHLHIVFENGTEAREYLLRSFSRVLYEDENGSQIVSAETGLPININASHVDLPIFGGDLVLGDEDLVTGQIYVVKSLSADTQVTSRDGKLYKIGFTTQKIETRMANAYKEPTFLCAPVEVVKTYTIANVRPSLVEKRIHEFFKPARLSIIVHLGDKIEPQEWFGVHVDRILEAIPLIGDGRIENYRYDRISEKIIPR